MPAESLISPRASAIIKQNAADWKVFEELGKSHSEQIRKAENRSEIKKTRVEARKNNV